MIDSGVILIVWVEPNCDGDLLARPGLRGASAIVAEKLAHDRGVVFFDALFAIINCLEVKV